MPILPPINQVLDSVRSNIILNNNLQKPFAVTIFHAQDRFISPLYLFLNCYDNICIGIDCFHSTIWSQFINNSSFCDFINYNSIARFFSNLCRNTTINLQFPNEFYDSILHQLNTRGLTLFLIRSIEYFQANLVSQFWQRKRDIFQIGRASCREECRSRGSQHQ